MGSIQRRAGSPYWYAYFNRWDASRKAWVPTSASTKCRDRDAAQGVLDGLESTARLAAGLPSGTDLTADQVRVMVHAILHAAGITIRMDHDTAPNLLAFIARYFALKQKRVRASTLVTYGVARKAFTTWLGPDRPMDAFTTADANDYYSHLLGRVSAKTANYNFRWLCGVFNHAVKEGVIGRNPCAAVDLAKSSTSQRLPFSLQEALDIIAHCAAGDARAVQWSRAASIGLLTGARLFDCIHMPRSALATATPHPVLSYQQSKTGKQVSIPLVLPALSRPLLRVRSHLFCPDLAAEWRRTGNSYLSHAFTQLVTAAGVQQSFTTDRRGRQLARKTFHSLRHTLRTAIVASGGSDAQADIILGHSPGQGRAYTHAELAATAAVLTRALAF